MYNAMTDPWDMALRLSQGRYSALAMQRGGEVPNFKDWEILQRGMMRGDGGSGGNPGHRPAVSVKMPNGQTMAFYQSSAGTSGKGTGKWYPYFGTGKGGWMIKGGVEQMKTGYGSKDIQNTMEWLNKKYPNSINVPATKPGGKPMGLDYNQYNSTNDPNGSKRKMFKEFEKGSLNKVTRSAYGNVKGAELPGETRAEAQKRISAYDPKNPDAQKYINELVGKRGAPAATVRKGVTPKQF